jgi:hypothetical protein
LTVKVVAGCEQVVEAHDGALSGARPGDVVEVMDRVMDRVMDEVAGARLEGEVCPVTSAPGSLPLLLVDLVEVLRECRGCLVQLSADGRRVLLPVSLLHGGLVLIPVWVERMILGQHQ